MAEKTFMRDFDSAVHRSMWMRMVQTEICDSKFATVVKIKFNGKPAVQIVLEEYPGVSNLEDLAAWEEVAFHCEFLRKWSNGFLVVDGKFDFNNKSYYWETDEIK